MTEASESKAYVADWLQQVPEFMSEVGLRDSDVGRFGSRLRWIGSGGRADAVFLGVQDGVKRVLKVTSDPTQAMLSQAAMEDRPVGIVPIYGVVETDILSRTGEGRTWGIVEKLVVPVSTLPDLYAMDMKSPPSLRSMSEDPMELYDRFQAAFNAWQASAPRGLVDPEARKYAQRRRREIGDDPLAEDWRGQIAAAVDWLQGVYPQRKRVVKRLDFHEENFGIDPDTGDLVLLDLGQG